MVKAGQEKPEALIPGPSCWAQRAWPPWELTRFSQPSAPRPSLRTDTPSLQGRESSGQLLSVLSGRMGESVERHLGSICQAPLAVGGEGDRFTPGQTPERLM